MYSEDDKRFMSLALIEAQAALQAGDYPVGAALVVNGRLWGTARNSLFSDARTTAHAEHKLLYGQSAQLRATILANHGADVSLYTTLEPCLMCLGIAVLHRVTTIIIACPDPSGGTTSMNISSLGTLYQRRWPEIHGGLFKDESCSLIIDFLKTEKFRLWESMLKEFQTMRDQWHLAALHEQR